MLEPPGFFGKVPARGDFLTRRIPPGLTGAWDAWLGDLTLSAKAAAAEAWPEAWLTAPLWHFALGAAVARPHGAAGVLIASVDRVGRMFPFTIVGPAPGVPDPAWSDTVEVLALGALDDAFDPDALDAALLSLGTPRATTPLPRSRSLWWCGGSDRVPPSRVLHDGLPDAAAQAAMVMG